MASKKQGQNYAQSYVRGHPQQSGYPKIVPNAHDVLCGRGVNISGHPGNVRFRALVNARQDKCFTSYSTVEKRAVAEEVIKHIKLLNPPGRFLKRHGYHKGLEGPWQELSQQETIKKTCQALRDCSRTDRTSYAANLAVPQDVQHLESLRTSQGLTNKQLAEKAAMALQRTAEEQARKLRRESPTPPSTEDAALWRKREKRVLTPILPATTPTTVASSGGSAMMHDPSLLEHHHSPPIVAIPPVHHSPVVAAVATPVHHSPALAAAASLLSSYLQHTMPPSPVAAATSATFDDDVAAATASFQDEITEEDSKPAARVEEGDGFDAFGSNDVDPLHELAAEAAASLEEQEERFRLTHPGPSLPLVTASLDNDEFSPPSPLRAADHHEHHCGDFSDGDSF